MTMNQDEYREVYNLFRAGFWQAVTLLGFDVLLAWRFSKEGSILLTAVFGLCALLSLRDCFRFHAAMKSMTTKGSEK